MLERRHLPATRVLRSGERTQAKDFMRIGETFSTLWPCRIGEGCCVGHQVEDHDENEGRYLRPEGRETGHVVGRPEP